MDVGIYEIPDVLYIQFELLIIPFFYLFMIRYLLIKKIRFEFLYFIPFFLGMLYQIWSVSFDITKKLIITLNRVVEISTIIYNIILIIVLFKEILRYEKNKDSKNINVPTKWIFQSLIIGIILIIIWMTSTLVLKTQVASSNNIYYPLWIGISILVLFLGTRAMIELDIISERKRIRKTKNENLQNSTDFYTQKTSYNTYQDIINEILNSKLYLRPTISLSSVAEEFGMSSNYISQLFGKHSEIGFNEYINVLRVEEAKKMLRNKAFRNYTTVAIGLESGFNSKSTFFSVFKKHTGITPSKFKNTLES